MKEKNKSLKIVGRVINVLLGGDDVPPTVKMISKYPYLFLD